MVQVLSHAMLKRNKSPFKILEIGPGTGIFTEKIHKLLKADDQLDVVELNPHFYEMISTTYQHDNVSVFHGNILEYDALHTYDFIFSSIPYESLPSSVSQKIWEKQLSLTHSGSYISYYKYVNFNRFRCKFEKEIVAKYHFDDKVILRNFPPARLFTLHITDPVYQEAMAI